MVERAPNMNQARQLDRRLKKQLRTTGDKQPCAPLNKRLIQEEEATN